MSSKRFLCRILPCFAAWGLLLAATAAEPSAESGWTLLAPCFQPPTNLAHNFGPYRSPLRFADGHEANTPAEWQERRREILAQWHAILGPWPPLISKPAIETVESTRRDNFTQHQIRLEIAPGQRAEAYLLIPDGPGPFPAVFVPFYDPETSIGLAGKPLRDFAYQLTRRGFVSLAIGSPGGDARKPDIGAAKCQPLSFLAYVAANAFNALASRPEVDAARIGVVGHSYGGKWAMFASCLDERFACAAWSDPGVVFDEARPSVNYWDAWYLGNTPPPKRPPGLPGPAHPRTGAYRMLVERGHDLPELHALMAPRPFFVSGGSEDGVERWKALNHALAVNRLLGCENRVGMSNRPKHDPTPESNELIYQFFEHFLKR